MNATQTTGIAGPAANVMSTASVAGEVAVARKPFVGLVPLAEEDWKLLAGRDDEVRAIMTNLRAARLTVVYGASGVGKSSVLRAGAVASLRALGEQELNDFGTPSFAVVYLNVWAGDPFVQLNESLQEGIRHALAVETLAPIPVASDLTKMLLAWSQRYGLELLIILDQFEEFFLYHGDEQGPGTFAHELPLAVNAPDLRARFMISMRDDSLHLLDRFQGRLPSLLENRLHVAPLTRARGRQAIEKAVSAYNETQPAPENVTPEEGLVEAVLEQVSIDNIGVAGVAKGAAAPTPAPPAAARAAAPSVSVTDGVDAPYMQLVMSRLWEEESALWKWGDGAPRSLRLKTLTDLGGAQAVVQQHLDKVLRNFTSQERDIAADCFHYLVTQSGTKYALTADELHDFTHHPAEEIGALLEKLADAKYRVMRRIDKKTLKGAHTAYEAHHDRLAVAMLAWRARKEEVRAERRKALIALSVLLFIGLIILLFVLTGGYLLHRKVAEEEVVSATKEAHDEVKAAQNNANRIQESANIAEEQLANANKADDTAEDKLRLIRDSVPKFVCGNVEAKLRQDAELIKQKLKIDCTQLALMKTAGADVQPNPRIYIQIPGEEQAAAAGDLRAWLSREKLGDRKAVVPSIENVGPRNLRGSQVRYFHKNVDEVDLAGQIALRLKKVCVDVTPTFVPGHEESKGIRDRHFELWFTPDALNDLCLPSGK